MTRIESVCVHIAHHRKRFSSLIITSREGRERECRMSVGGCSLTSGGWCKLPFLTFTNL